MASLDQNAWFVPNGGYRDAGGGVDVNQISVADSICTLNAVYDPMTFSGGPGQTPATLPVRFGTILWNKMLLLYGTVEVRGKFTGLGTHTAFWMLDCYDRAATYQCNSWGVRPSGSGVSDEIDIAETCPASFGNLTTLRQNTFANGGSTVDSTTTTDANLNFHTYKMVWTPTSVTFFIDGVQTNQSTVAIPSHPLFFICDIELADGCGGAVDQANFPTANQIDYVKAWDSNNNLVFSDDFDGTPAFQDLTMTNLVFAQANSSTPAVNVSTADLAFLSDTQSESYLLAYCLMQSSGQTTTLTSVTDSRGNTWQIIYSGPGRVYIAQVPANKVGGGANTVTFHFSAPSQTFIVLGVIEYTGQNPATPIDAVKDFTDFTGTAYTGTPVTTSHPNELVLGLGFSSTNGITAGTNGFTLRASGPDFMLFDAPADAIGTYTPSAISSVGGEWDLNTVALFSSSSLPLGGGVLTSREAKRFFGSRKRRARLVA